MDGLLQESVDALSLNEALLLARELPHLGRLMRGELDGVARDTCRRLALGVLNVAQGNPEMLKLADRQAAKPARLAQLVESGDQAWRDAGGMPDGFFTTGETRAAPGDYLQVLAAWTRTVTDTLTDGERDLFWYLCCLEEPDRIRLVIESNWGRLWTRLGRSGPQPGIHDALAAVAARGLAALPARSLGEAAPQGLATTQSGEPDSYMVHPGVADAGRNQAGQEFRDAADIETAAYWTDAFLYASGNNGNGVTDTGLMVHAGLAAIPYLLRQQQWNDAAALLARAFTAEPLRANAAAALPAIQEITAHEPHHTDVLARVLQVTDPATAKSLMRDHLDEAAASSDYEVASVTAGLLIDMYLDSGRLAEALSLTAQLPDYTRQAGLGPWTQLSNEVRRLQVLNAMGHARQVLTDVQQLRDHLLDLPATPGLNEIADPQNVREILLGTGGAAALQLNQWDEALALTAEQVTCMHERGAPAVAIACALFNIYGPLLRLGRTDQALELLQNCRQAFYDAHDTRMLGKVFTALADAEDERGHGDAAIRLEHDALRYKYLTIDVTGIAVGYHNLGNYLAVYARQPRPALASHPAAALIRTIADIDAQGTRNSVIAAAADLHKFGFAAAPPVDIAVLSRQLGDIPGTDLEQLITDLAPDPDAAGQTLRGLIAQAEAAASREHR